MHCRRAAVAVAVAPRKARCSEFTRPEMRRAACLGRRLAGRLRVRLGHVPHIRLATGRRRPGLRRGGTPALYCARGSWRVLPSRGRRRCGGGGRVGGYGCRLRPWRAVLKAWIVGIHCLQSSFLPGEDTVATQQASDAQSEQASDDHYGYHASHHERLGQGHETSLEGYTTARHVSVAEVNPAGSKPQFAIFTESRWM